MPHPPWIVVIAPFERTAREVALEIAFDRGLNARNVSAISARSTPLRSLEGSRPDEIHIVEYLRWGCGTTELWLWICRTILKHPGTKRVWR